MARPIQRVPYGYPAGMEAAYLVVLVAACVGVGVMSFYVLYKLFAGQR